MRNRVLRNICLIVLIVSLPLGSVFALIGRGWVQSGNNTANIRKLAGLSATGYNVIQGSCSDGDDMFYFAFMKKSSERIKIVKMKLDNGEYKLVEKSPMLKNTYHGNDLAYVSDLGGIEGNDKILITNSIDGFTNHITVFDVERMRAESEQIVCRYWNDYSECELYDKGKLQDNPMKLDKLINEKHGFSGIAYDAENERLVVGLASKHDLMTFRINYMFDEITLVPTSYIIQSRTESTFQGIDCDSEYIYSCWSPAYGVSTVNRIYKYNWQGKKICKFDIDKTYELESLSHIGDTFYGTYHHSYVHKYTTKKKVKVKVKKVWNKAHTKKIWKYKIKTKKIKHSEIRRNAYVKKLCLSNDEAN